MLLLLALLALCWLLVSGWRKYARVRRMELAIPGPPSLPILGNTLDMLGATGDDMLDTLMRLWGGRTSELSRMSILNHLIVFVTDPDHVAKVIPRNLDGPHATE